MSNFRRAARPLAAVVGGLLVWLLQSTFSVAFAHAILMQSTPAADAAVAGPEVAFDLRFNSRVDQKRSLLILRRGQGQSQAEGKRLKLDLRAPVDRLRAHATVTPGSYILRWQVLAIDGHITRGDVPFTVTAGAGSPTPDPAPASNNGRSDEAAADHAGSADRPAVPARAP